MRLWAASQLGVAVVSFPPVFLSLFAPPIIEGKSQKYNYSIKGKRIGTSARSHASTEVRDGGIRTGMSTAVLLCAAGVRFGRRKPVQCAEYSGSSV